MSREDTQWRPVAPASLHWSDVNEPISAEFGDIYYSRDNGLEESRYVFLEGNALPQRWQQHPRGHFCIAESGFGNSVPNICEHLAIPYTDAPSVNQDRIWCRSRDSNPDRHTARGF